MDYTNLHIVNKISHCKYYLCRAHYHINFYSMTCTEYLALFDFNHNVL
jgi:hypothetical protein